VKLFDLTGKVAVVTGGNGGIGLGMAEGLAAAGADLVIAARDIAKSEAAADRLRRHGRRVAVVALDVTDAEACRAVAGRVVTDFGRLDILINNAGINIRKPPETYTAAEWREVLAINLDGAFYMAQAVHNPMKASGGGKIITTGSMLSLFGAPFAAAYGASKGGIVQLTKALATSWAPDNIQVNAILPGWIDTDLTKRARADVQGLHEKVLARTPQGRWGTPEDFAGAAVFLSSAASAFVTGSVLAIDGGYSAMV
jgi:2-dehydro-3-deoxy-D-gluconate 5-dehydrogenase